MDKVDIKNLTPEAKARLLEELQADKAQAAAEEQAAYENLRKDFIVRTMRGYTVLEEDPDGGEPMLVYKLGVEAIRDMIQDFFQFVVKESTAFHKVMQQYGKLNREGQMNYKITDGDYRVEVKTNKIKSFDERAEIAAGRLINFLQEFIKNSAKGTEDPMYQLAMSMLARNQNGDLDYKSISKLYELEPKFNSAEFSEIMQLFKESNQVEGTTTNFYFFKRDKLGVWRKLEISFNRL